MESIFRTHHAVCGARAGTFGFVATREGATRLWMLELGGRLLDSSRVNPLIEPGTWGILHHYLPPNSRAGVPILGRQ